MVLFQLWAMVSGQFANSLSSGFFFRCVSGIAIVPSLLRSASEPNMSIECTAYNNIIRNSNSAFYSLCLSLSLCI